jgi:hypothetical protein
MKKHQDIGSHVFVSPRLAAGMRTGVSLLAAVAACAAWATEPSQKPLTSQSGSTLRRT